MLDIQKLIIAAMKNSIFPGEENKKYNLAARQVLAEIKTKLIDIREEVTTEIQYKILQKMKKERLSSIDTYIKIFQESGSIIAKENLEKAKNELESIDLFLLNLESEMPKKMSEEETKSLIEDIIKKFEDENTKPNKGMIMKLLKSRIDIDMALAAKILGSFGI